MEKKRKSVVKKVSKRLALVMGSINVLVVIFIALYASIMMSAANEEYILEVVDNITSTVETTMESYFQTAETLAANQSIKTLLEESSKANPMPKNRNINSVLSELSKIVSNHHGSIINITILSVAEDSYIMSDGEVSTRSTVTDRSYYKAVTSKTTIITDPYVQSQNNTRVVSTSSPVFADDGSVLGCVVVNIPTSFVTNLISEFGSTGSTWVIDGNDSVVAHGNTSYIGENYSVVGVSGAELVKELSNPTGSLIHYDRNNEARTGSVGHISSLGWRLIAGMDTSEFYEDTVKIAVILIITQFTSVTLSMIVCSREISLNLKPIQILNESMLEMSKGNLSALPDHDGDDEIGELCDNLTTTMTNLDIYINEIRANLNAFGNGDFTRKSELEFLGDFRAIQTSTDDFVELITSTLHSLKSSVEQVNGSSEFVSSGSQNLASGSIQQAESVNVLNENIETITQSVEENVKNVEYVNERSHTAAIELATSNEKMVEMVKAMKNIQEASESIENVIKTIEDVAFQTNILALNAAVEAARAGEHGKGFAVVADEVRNLAGRSSKAVEETAKLIGESQDAVTLGSQIVEETEKALVEAIEIVNGYMATLDQVTESSKGQAVAIAEVNSRVADITTVTQNNTAISEESAAASEELSSQANLMKDSIEQFKLH